MYQNIFRTNDFPDFFAGLSPEIAAAVFAATMTDLKKKGAVIGAGFSPRFVDRKAAEYAFKLACRIAIVEAIQGIKGYVISDTTTELPSINTFFPDEIRRVSSEEILHFATTHPNLREWNNAFQKTHCALTALAVELPESKASGQFPLLACLTVENARSHSLDFLVRCYTQHPSSDAFHLWRALHEVSTFLEDTIATLNIGRHFCCFSLAKHPLQIELEALNAEMTACGPISLEQFGDWTQRLDRHFRARPGEYIDLQTAWHNLLDTHPWILPSRKASFSTEVMETVNPARAAALSRERASWTSEAKAAGPDGATVSA